MIKDQVKKESGITLATLAIAVTILIIIVDVIVYNLKDRLEVENLKEMQNDIENLSDKISAYYAKNGKIPASIQYTDIQKIREAGVISDETDTGRFLVIDLSAIENLTLHRGKDFQKIKDLGNKEEVSGYEDIYIINETSHNIFYVGGITMNEQTFYTNYTRNDVDKKAVNLKYVDGVKIPEGFRYIGNKEVGILVTNDKGESYKWISVDQKITELPNDVVINNSEKEDFIKSVNVYHGYYKESPEKETNHKVKYLAIDDNWSPKYDTEGIYRDKNGDTVYIPSGFQVSETPGENIIEKGLVVKDSQNNEWVWVEVPKTIYETAQSSDDYANIEKDMQTYTSAYKNSSYSDIWYSEEQHGFSSANEYYDWKNGMLKSVYENGGFYIGRYEAGTPNLRTSNSVELTDTIIQRGAYPYNYITCKQAQEKSNNLSVGERKSSLMFGIQWDLVMKFIEDKGDRTQTDLKVNSGEWGNYSTAEFNVIRGKYSYDMGKTFSDVSNNFIKNKERSILLTTGATDRNSVLNIYDIAGNLWEYTLESINITDRPCAIRGGYCSNYATACPASARYREIQGVDYVSFRPCLW